MREDLHSVGMLNGGEKFIVYMSDHHSRIRGTTPEIEAAARRLRQNMTPAEQRLWAALKNRQINGLKFRAQHPVGHFIVDFYCPACRLVIEVDGLIHQTQADYDIARTQQLEAYGYKVLRFTNHETMHHLTDVLNTICQTISRLKTEQKHSTK